VSHDLLPRLRQHAVDPVVITYARDALASGHTVELTVRRLRGLGLCPQSFLDRRRAKLHPSRIARSARDSEVSGQPIRERFHELGDPSVIGFLEHRLVYRRSLIFCGRPYGPLYAPIIATPLMLSQAELSLIGPRAT
jgi:hypothetical protein